jgi:septal ring-binding cell division protein DamX
VALAIIGVILAIVALSNQKQEAMPTPTATPVASVPPGATPTISPLPSPTTDPNLTPTPSVDTGTPTAEPTVTDTPSPEPTDTATPDSGGSGTFPGWTGSDGDYTIIIESASSQSGAEKVAQEAQDGGLTVGILKSDDYSSLNGGYWVVFTGDYSSKSDAVADLDGVRADYHDAYVKQIKA